MKKLDLTGLRFGDLTVLRPAENIRGRTAWVCRCCCGQETVVRTYRLREGRTKSCGCKHCTAVMGMIKVRKNNTSGVPGVFWWKARQRWRANICFEGKWYYLGAYPKFEDAAKARKQAEENLRDHVLREFASVQIQDASG